MSELKTKPGDADVAAFIDPVEDPVRWEAARALCRVLERVTR